MQTAANPESRRTVYARRVPEDTVLYGVVSDQLNTFFSHAESSGREVPAFVTRELTRYLECGILAHGFVRSALAAAVLQLFVRSVFISLRRRARRSYGTQHYECGAIKFVQRFGDALNLNLHFHSIVVDGVYEHRQDGSPRFRRLPAPTDAEVGRTTCRIVRRLRRLLIQRGLTPDADASTADLLPEGQPLLAELYAASVRSRIAMGDRAGLGVLRIGHWVDPEEATFVTGRRCAMLDGVSLHANVAVPPRDRRRLEKLCRYVARPPVSTERLSRLSDGRLLYRLKRKWRDGTTHVVFEPIELVEKLASIVPPPRIHMIRYHGVLAPRAGKRRQIVPAKTVAEGEANNGTDATEPCAHAPKRWTAWATLMQRVFPVDVLECPRCGGKMKILATIHPPEATTAILESLGLSPRAPPIAPPAAR